MSEQKRRGKEIYKVILAGGMAVSLFAGGFIALNHYVFAAAYDKPIELQASWQEPETMTPQVSGYVKADYRVEEDPVFTCSNPNAISAIEAAELGAQYLWDVYGLDLSGRTIYMSYFVDLSSAIGHWYGDVSEKGGDKINAPYSFVIEAVSGERKSIYYNSENEGETIPYDEEEATEYYRQNGSEYLEMAKTFARKQMTSVPVKAELLGTSASLARGYDYEMPEGTFLTMETEESAEDVIMIPLGEKLPATNVYVNILVTGESGEQIEVSIDVTDKSLQSMSKVYNGIDYAPYGVG